MKSKRSTLVLTAGILGALPLTIASAQSGKAIPPSMITPDLVETGLGKLTFQNGSTRKPPRRSRKS